MKKFLIVAHYSRFLVQFELNDVRLLQLMGFEVHYATNYQQEDMFSGAIKIIQENGVILHQIDFVRSPYNIPANIKAYRQLKKKNFQGCTVTHRWRVLWQDLQPMRPEQSRFFIPPTASIFTRAAR